SVPQRIDPGREDHAHARNRDGVDQLQGGSDLPRQQQEREQQEAGPALLHARCPVCSPCFSCAKMPENRRWRSEVKRSSSRVLIWLRGYGRSMARSSRMAAGVLVRETTRLERKIASSTSWVTNRMVTGMVCQIL